MSSIVVRDNNPSIEKTGEKGRKRKREGGKKERKLNSYMKLVANILYRVPYRGD